MTTSGPDERAAELLRLAALVTDGLLEFDEYQAMEAEILGGSAVVEGETAPGSEAAPRVSRRRSPDGR